MDQRWSDMLAEMKADNVSDATRATVAMNYFKREIEPGMLTDNLPPEIQSKVKTNFLGTLRTLPEKQSFWGLGRTKSAVPLATAIPSPAKTLTGWTPEPSTLPLDPIGQLLKTVEASATPVKEKTSFPTGTVSAFIRPPQMEMGAYKKGKGLPDITEEKIKSVGKVAAAAVGGLLAYPVSGLAGMAAGIDAFDAATKAGLPKEERQRLALDAASKAQAKVAGAPFYLLTNDQEKKAMVALQKPFEIFGMAGEGWKQIVGLTPLRDTIAEPIAGFIGEAAALFGLPQLPRAVKASTWYRKLTIPERALADKITAGINEDIKSGKMTGDEIRAAWRDPANREELLRRYQGVEKKPTEKTPAAGAPDTATEPHAAAPKIKPEAPVISPEAPPVAAPGLPSWVPRPKGPVMTPGGPVDIVSTAMEAKTLPTLETLAGQTAKLNELDQEVATKRDDIIRWSKNQAEADGWLDKWTPERAIDEWYKRGLSTSTRTPLKKNETWRSRLVKLAEKEGVKPVKQPWEMTADEYVEPKFEVERYKGISRGAPQSYIRQHEDSVRNRLIEEHFNIVNQAIQEGKEVPVFNKPLWMRTQKEHVDYELKKLRDAKNFEADTPAMLQVVKDEHQDEIKQALSESKPVPLEVLADYPDLQTLGPIKKLKTRKPSSGAQALMAATVAEMKKAGGLKLGAVELTGIEKKRTGAYGITDSTTIRSLIKQYPGLLRRNGEEWDEAAEQWGFASGADLLEALKDPTRGPSMRTNMAEMPEAEEAKVDKQLEREIWENAERELTAFAESEGLDAGAIQQGQRDSKESILDEIRAEGIIDPTREAEVLKELEDFFAEVGKQPAETLPRKVTGQGDLEGMSYAKTFGLVRPKGKFRPFVEKPPEPPTGALFEPHKPYPETSPKEVTLGGPNSPVRENGGYTSILLKDGTALVGGTMHGETYNMAVKAGFSEDLVGNGMAGWTRPDGTTWNLQGKFTKAVKVINLDVPEATSKAEGQVSEPYESALDKNGNYDIVQAKEKGLITDELQQDVVSLGSSFTSQRLQISSTRRGGVAKSGGVKTIASAIPKDLLKKGYINLRGAEVKNSRDLAAVAQIFRDPRLETLRIFYVKNGKIVTHEGLSNRMPGFVSFYPEKKAPQEILRIHSRIKRTGADQIYLLHNHPSGRPIPSSNDIYFTRLLSEGQVRSVKGETEPLPLVSHVIIDDKQYAEISRRGAGQAFAYKLHDLPEGKEYGEPTVPHDFLAKEVNSQRDIVDIGAALKRQEGYVTLIYRSSTGKLAGIQDVWAGLLKGPDAMGFLKNRAKEFGAREIMAYVDDVETVGVPRIKQLIEYGGLRDVLSKYEGFAKQYQTIPGVVFGEPIAKYQPTRVSEEAAEYKTEAEQKEYAERERRIIELPEIVEIAKELLGGKYPKTNRFLRSALGRFYPGTGKISVINTMNPKELARVLAHEIGHLNDWLPDQSMRKGNILGRIASIVDYRKSLLEEYPDAPAKILTDQDRARLRTEAERQVKKEAAGDAEIVEEIIRVIPQYEKAAITPEMILDILRGRTNEPDVLLRFLQEVDGTTKKEIAKQALKNLVDESLAGLEGRKIVGYETIVEKVVRPSRAKTEEAALVAKRYRELLKQEIIKRKLYEEEIVKRELKNLTKMWNPFTEVPGTQYTKYRLSSKELYADAMSVLMNDPSLLKKTAPTFNKAFFNWLGKKSEFKANYDALQERIEDPEAVLTKRREFIRQMALKDAEERARHLEESRQYFFKPSRLGSEIRRLVINEQTALAGEKVREWQRVGATIPDHMRIDYWTEELPYINSEVNAFTRDVEKNIIDAGQAEGISLVDLHEYMELKRAATERKGIYNPGGIGDALAVQQLEKMKRDVGEQKFANIERFVGEFRSKFERHVLKVVDQANFLPPKLMMSMLNNPNYATFSNLEYEINRHYGVGPGAHIYRQYGMLGEVRNVFIQTVLKGQALIRAARHHETKMALLTALAREGAEGEIIKAKRGYKGVGWENPPDGSYGTIIVSPRGQVQAYHVDKEFADLWKRQPDKANLLLALGAAQKAILAKIYIAWNAGWLAANPIRDVMGSWKKLPEASGFIASGFYRTAKDAFRAGFGKLPERELRLLRERKIVPERFWMEEMSWDAQERELLAHTMDPIRYSNDFLGAIIRAKDYIRANKLDRYMIAPPVLRFANRLGQSLERWGKMGPEEAIRLRQQATGIPVGQKREAHLVRARAGTPNSLAKGIVTRYTELLFPFSNIAIQDIQSSAEAAREKPWTYTFKTLVANILPKIMLAVMVAGWFDWISEDIKDNAKKAGRYIRRMYNVFPLGQYGDDGVFLKVPQDYTGQIAGALADAIISGDFGGSMGTLGQVVEGQPYNLSPFLQTAGDWVNYYAREIVPRNYFYGMDIMSEQVARAGGKEAFKAMSRETWNQFFGTMLYRFRPDSVKETNAEIKDLLGTPPLNALGRFVAVTDQGIREWNREITKKVRKEEALEQIEMKKGKIEAINKLLVRPTREDAHRHWSALIEEGKLDPVQTPFRSFANSYVKMGTRKEGNPYLDAFASATTNRQKVAFLEAWKKELKSQEYKQIFNMLVESKLITPDVERKATQGP